MFAIPAEKSSLTRHLRRAGNRASRGCSPTVADGCGCLRRSDRGRVCSVAPLKPPSLRALGSCRHSARPAVGAARPTTPSDTDAAPIHVVRAARPRPLRARPAPCSPAPIRAGILGAAASRAEWPTRTPSGRRLASARGLHVPLEARFGSTLDLCVGWSAERPTVVADQRKIVVVGLPGHACGSRPLSRRCRVDNS